MSGDYHVYPVRDLVDHDTEARSCWCDPRIAVPCDEHDDDRTCWKCDEGGLVDVGPGVERSVLVIHDAADGRE